MRHIFAIICLTSLFTFQAAPSWAKLEVGQNFGDLTFNGTISAADRAYLGLTRPGPFTLKEVQADYLVLEFFSDSCGHCALQVPVADRLFQLIEDNPKWAAGNGKRARLKMMGLGYYCTPEQLAQWRKEYEPSFPLIPDPKGQVERRLDVPGTPTYVVLDRQGTVVYFYRGDLRSPQQFLRTLRSHLNL